MRDDDELDSNIPPLVPDRDHVDTHKSNKRARSREIVRPTRQARSSDRNPWPLRGLLTLLVLFMIGGGYAGYYFYTEVYATELRQANLRISDLETRLALMGETAEESDNSLMEDINKTIEQYDLLWANWRNNNRQFADIQGEIARLKQANEGQDELAANTSQQLAESIASLTDLNARLNGVSNELSGLDQEMSQLDASIAELSSLRSDVEAVRQNLNSGDDTVLGLAGRLEYIEQSMESVNAHRLQINESLFRLQESIDELQRTNSPGG